MSEHLPLDVFKVFSAVADYRVYTISCPPNLFGSSITSVLHQGIENDVSNYPHPNSDCTDKCTKCLLFTAFTAVKAVFAYDCTQHWKTVKKLSLNNCLNSPDAREISTFQKSLSCEQIENMNKWYRAASVILVANNLINLLVEYVKSSCTFTAFLAKKSLLSALYMKLYEVHCFIKILEQNWQAGINPSSSFVEVVKNLLSYKDPQLSVCSETFACVQSFGYIHSFLSRKTDPKTKTFSNTDGIFDYLCLIHKIIKCGLTLIDCGPPQISDYFFLCSLFQNSILPFTEAFFSTMNTLQEHLICLKYLKCISSLFDVKFLQSKNLPPQCIVDLGNRVSATLLRCPSSYSLLVDSNFVCSNLHKAKCDQRLEDPQKGVSAITKLLVDATFKVHAITLTGNENFQPSMAAELFSLLCKIQELVIKCERDSEEWLTVIFADQDDKWISSLLCLLIVHRKITLRLEELTRTEKDKDFEDFDLEKLLHFICPHRLFLQLARFLGYDHLVLADFLTSPETHFLYYFNQYLHTVNKNWTYFYSICCEESLSSNSIKIDTISPKGDAGMSASYHPTVQPVVELISCHSYFSKHSTHLLSDVKRELSDEETLNERKLYGNEENDFQHLDWLREEKQVIDPFFHDESRVARKKQVVLVSYSDSEDNEEEASTEKSNPLGGLSCKSNMKTSIACTYNEDAARKKSNSTDFDGHNNQVQNSRDCQKIPEDVVLVMEMFIRLRLYLERLVDKNIFPYNVKPLLRLLEVCEDAYDDFITSSYM